MPRSSVKPEMSSTGNFAYWRNRLHRERNLRNCLIREVRPNLLIGGTVYIVVILTGLPDPHATGEVRDLVIPTITATDKRIPGV